MPNDKTLALWAVEHWKLLRVFRLTIGRLPHEHVARTTSQLRYADEKLDYLLKECGLKLVVFEGKRHEPNNAATAVNADDFADNDALIVRTTLEPAVIKDMSVLLMGKVVLGRIEEGTRNVSGN